jgi:hypothetical protein
MNIVQEILHLIDADDKDDDNDGDGESAVNFLAERLSETPT